MFVYTSPRVNVYILQTTIREKVQQLKVDVPEINMHDVDDVDNSDDQRTWTQQPYQKMTLLRKTDAVSHVAQACNVISRPRGYSCFCLY